LEKSFELWQYKHRENPVAEFASRHIVNLPTHEGIDENYVDRISKFLRKHKDQILGCKVEKMDAETNLILSHFASVKKNYLKIN